MGAFALSAGVTVRMKPAIKDRLKHIHDCMMHDPITEWSGGNQPRLGAGNAVRSERTRAVGPTLQISHQTQQHVFLSIIKAAYRVAVTLTPPGLPGRQDQILPGDQLRPKVCRWFHCRLQ